MRFLSFGAGGFGGNQLLHFLVFGEDKDSFDDRKFGGQKIAGSLGARERGEGGAYFPERADPPRSWASTGVVGASGAWRAPGGVSQRFASVFCAARSESRPRPPRPEESCRHGASEACQNGVLPEHLEDSI